MSVLKKRFVPSHLLIFLNLLFILVLLSPPAMVHAKIRIATPKEILKFNDHSVRLPIFSVFVLPETKNILTLPQDATKNEIQSSSGTLKKINARKWEWLAPKKPGNYSIKIFDDKQQNSLTLNIFVLIPFEKAKNGKLNGYNIGKYPNEPLRGLNTYATPKGFIQVTTKNKNLQLTPHFRLSQFLCKQKKSGTQYIVIQEKLLVLLEDFADFIEKKGYPAHSLTIMSGYRTPNYNATIGNKTQYSRHVWGDAVDVYIDQSPKDGYLDDLNKDGKITNADVDMLYQWMHAFQQRYQKTSMIGGLAPYQIKGSRTPFVHIDTRGYKARWNS